MIPFALHIPDGFLSVKVAALGWIVFVPFLIWASYGSRSLEDRFVPVAGLLSAFVFAAQTLQFPIPGGTSGHLVGASLVTILLGPAMGMMVLTAVLLLEATVFGTGGLLALGWNGVNMVVVMGLLGGAIYHSFRARGASVSAAAFCSGWISTQFGSLVTCLELAAAGTSPLQFSLPAMMATQALVGIGEGLVTASAVAFLARSRPDLVPEPQGPSPDPVTRGTLFETRTGAGVLVAVLLCCALPPSFYGVAVEKAPFSGYLAAVVGLALALLTSLAWLLAGLGRRKASL